MIHPMDFRNLQPKVELLSPELVANILEEAFRILLDPGVKIQSAEARGLLAEAGAQVSETTEIAKIPEKVARTALQTVPRSFFLYNRQGEAAVTYGGDAVHFDPGSSGVHILDPETLEHRPSHTQDLTRLVQVTEMLPQYAAQSTAVVCHDVPKEIGDFYRLYVVLTYSQKPVVTGAFSLKTLPIMIEMLAIMAGGHEALRKKPLAVFDVCPTPPLIWSEFGAGNLIELARASMPAEMVSMPLAGAASPVTLAGSIIQHAAESLSGIVIHQLARPGAPIVWGGAPAIFDMRKGTTPMGAIETAMMDAAYAQVGKSLGLPTHTYLGASDAKIVDAQAGLESGMSALIGALAGINMISGAGMLDFLACHSPEKLVVDAEAISMVQRFLSGIQTHQEFTGGSLAAIFYEGFQFKGDFLKQKLTRQLFSKEQYLPSTVIDRDSIRGWQQQGSLDTFTRAKDRTRQLLAEYQSGGKRPEIESTKETALQNLVTQLARQAGMDPLPDLS